MKWMKQLRLVNWHYYQDESWNLASKPLREDILKAEISVGLPDKERFYQGALFSSI